MVVFLFVVYKETYGMITRRLGPFDRRLLAAQVKLVGTNTIKEQLKHGEPVRYVAHNGPYGPIIRDIVDLDTFPCITFISVFARDHMHAYSKNQLLLAQDIFNYIDEHESKNGYIPYYYTKVTPHEYCNVFPNNRLDFNTHYWHKKEAIECLTQLTYQHKKNIEEVLTEVDKEQTQNKAIKSSEQIRNVVNTILGDL